ncbi:MAG: methyl-accepting chemotaxis sensory transducer [Anaerosolibacter sp.]|uniref:methyl-accepting chemotaxis protein n=1 Tax=Anaerosolibacter sp. TaxID=1872527 RepID=UPI00262EDACD|nr:methyl-accepting chemotaxis protein [Anaerosolibacter sp.]MDF2545949.1 methyl-accepting chemotaxis sensory transducer [Anaerosolibacter sp.]
MSIIDTKFAQELVELIYKETNQNAHIFGEGGKIIATTQPERLGTIHTGAKDIMAGKVDHIAITEEMARTMSGTRPGFSVGIHSKNARIGAIGISGDPQLMKPIAMIASHVIVSEYERKVFMDNINIMASTINNSLQESSAALEEISSSSKKQEKTVEDLSGKVFEAKNNVMKTNQIIDLIQKISKQTKILGINASIEAARLGNEGKGFDVVANEVRKLAESTATSVNQIDDILKTMQNIIVNISENIQSYTVSSKNQTQMVQSLSSELENISISLDNFTKMLS